MKTAVWKFTVPKAVVTNCGGYFELHLPSTHKFLTAQVQFGVPVMWFSVAADSELQQRRFRLVATGDTCGGELLCAPYLGTVQLNEGTLVLHLFDATP